MKRSWKYSESLLIALSALEIKYKLTDGNKRVKFEASKQELAAIKELIEEV